MRRVLFSLMIVWAALAAVTLAARAQMSEAQVAQALVGSWGWQGVVNGTTVNYQLTLAGGGDFTFTSAMQTYQVTSAGRWQYRGGWLQFQTTWSSSLDPAGRFIVVGPIRILEVGRDFVRTPQGLAHRLG